MAKTAQSAKQSTTTYDNNPEQVRPKTLEKAPPAFERPEGFQKRTSDLVGYWNPKRGPIQGIPMHAKLFDGKKFDKSKPSMLITIQLTKPLVVDLKREEDAEESETYQAEVGDYVGVWGKPGMRDIRQLAGVEVFIFQDGEKDIGKGQPMKLYDVSSAKLGERLRVTEDTREHSREASTFLDETAPKLSASFTGIPVDESGKPLF